MSHTLPKPALGMVFGVFDGLHPGHRYFLETAAARCGRLVVVVAVPEMVTRLKGRLPKLSLAARMRALLEYRPDWIVVPGDAEPGTWSALEAHRPDAVFLGYDQTALAEACRSIAVPTVFIDAYCPDRYKSSLLNRRA